MQRRTISLFIVLIALFLAFRYCNSKPAEAPRPEEKQEPLSILENSGPFNQSFHSLLGAYFSLKEALVSSDTAKANAASEELAQRTGDLRLSEINGDTSGMIKETAGSFAAMIKGSANTLAVQPDLESKRKEFETITDALWSLTRTVRYDGEKVYYQYCPMAFDDKGAYWMSDERQIRNPYFGDKMLNCGEVADSLDYSKR